MFPEFPVIVPSFVQEYFVLMIGDFIAVYKEIIQPAVGRFRAWHAHHAQRDVSLFIQYSNKITWK